MASKELYEPAARFVHVSFLAEGKVYLWGGETQDGSEDDGIKLANCIEQFDPYLEVWSQVNTAGTPHHGLVGASCASSGEHVYMYGGLKGYKGVLSCLDVKSLTWSQLSPEGGTAGGPILWYGAFLPRQASSDRWVWTPQWSYPTWIIIHQGHQVH